MNKDALGKPTFSQDAARRARTVNELLLCISELGRGFFRYESNVASFEVSKNRVYFVDHYSRKRIYTHREGRWHGFTSGGTLRRLVVALRDFIRTGFPIESGYFGPWPESLCDGDLWGYGKENMKTIREVAIEKGIARAQDLTREQHSALRCLVEGDPIAWTDDDGVEHESVVKYSAWQLGGGHWVIGIKGKTGGYSLERCRVLVKKGI